MLLNYFFWKSNKKTQMASWCVLCIGSLSDKQKKTKNKNTTVLHSESSPHENLCPWKQLEQFHLYPT